MSPDDTRPPDLVWPEHEEFNTRPNARGPRVRSFDPSALRALRTNSQLTRDQLAEQIGTSVSSVKMWETGHRTPTARVADRIAEVLGVSPATLSGPEPVFDPAANTLRAVRLRAKLNAQDIADAREFFAAQYRKGDYETPEAAVAFAEVEQWGRADVQGTV